VSVFSSIIVPDATQKPRIDQMTGRGDQRLPPGFNRLASGGNLAIVTDHGADRSPMSYRPRMPNNKPTRRKTVNRMNRYRQHVGQLGGAA
jgi:hypothetical protein